MGFEKGKPRPANAGRKKGTTNKVTFLAKQLKETPDQREAIMDRLWALSLGMEVKGCSNAARVWLNEYNTQQVLRMDNILENPLYAKLKTLEDVNKVSQEIHEQMLRNELPISTGERLLNTLSLRQKHIEGQLSPELQKILAEQDDQLKLKD